MRTVFAYLRKNAGAAALFCLFAAIFAVVFYFSGVPVDSVGYAAILCVFIGLVCLAVGCFRHAERHRSLTESIRNPSLPSALPAAKDIIDADYQRIIIALREQLAIQEAENGRRLGDQVDYYTAWTHQIKTPIAAMDLLLNDRELDRAAMRNQLLRIEQYAEMALGYQRLDGGTDLRIGRYDLDGIVRKAVKKYAAWFIRQGLVLDYEPLEGRVLTDEKWLVFVVEQLLSNTLKYTPLGSVSIYTEPGPVLVIRDTGIGIGAEDLPLVFQKGYTGFNGRQEARSTGIGLYLCQQVCAMLGHTISIESTPGEGTAVRLGLKEKEFQIE